MPWKPPVPPCSPGRQDCFGFFTLETTKGSVGSPHPPEFLQPRFGRVKLKIPPRAEAGMLLEKHFAFIWSERAADQTPNMPVSGEENRIFKVHVWLVRPACV